MKQLLLTCMLSASLVGLAVAAPTTNVQMAKAVDKVTVNKTVNSKLADVKRLAPGVTLSTAGKMKKLHSLRLEEQKNVRVQAKAQYKAESTLPDGYVLFESFEGWDGEDAEWTPDGWVVEMKGNVERDESWTPSATSPFLPGPSDGECYYGINYSSGNQDEWLITPEVQLGENMVLSYWLYLEPFWLFGVDNVDWETFEYIGDKVVAATLQIWVQPAGGEWTMIHDYVDDYINDSALDLMYAAPAKLEKKSESLAEFANQKVKVAFCYVGTDGNTMFIDAIGIGLPSIDGVSYMNPLSTQYWGFGRTCDMSYMQAAIAQYPVYEPLTWTNMTWLDDATFTWEYCDPETAEFVTSNDPYELTVEYVPDYTSPTSMRNNFFYPPTLTANVPGCTPGTFTAPYDFFQAGGKPEYKFNSGEEFSANLLPFDFQNAGLGYTVVDDPEIGDPIIPVFGYNLHTDEYWLNYSLNGETALEGNFSHLIGIANLIWPTAAPMVVNGVTVYGMGQIGADVELKATIYALNEELSKDFSTFTVIASATVKGSAVDASNPTATGYLAIPFDFDSPAVIQATEEHPAYFVMFEGFNNEGVEYFVPFQAVTPDPNEICWGYILNEINLDGHIDKGTYLSLKPMVYKVGNEYIDPYSSFAIGLEAEYPWLTTDCEGIEFTSEQPQVEVELGSYYDGSQLTVTAPAGVTATVAGRYNECVLTAERNNAEVIVEGDIVVEGPGVKVSIPVKDSPTTGISAINAAGAAISGIYDLSGRRVEAPAKGIYIVKYTDGTVSKSVVK